MDILVDSFLEQSPACLWIAGMPQSSRRAVDAVRFERVWGNAVPLFGKPGAELVGQRCPDVLSHEMAALWCGRFERAFEGEVLSLRERRQETVWYVSVFPVRTESNMRYAGGIGREITQWSTA